MIAIHLISPPMELMRCRGVSIRPTDSMNRQEAQFWSLANDSPEKLKWLWSGWANLSSQSAKFRWDGHWKNDEISIKRKQAIHQNLKNSKPCPSFQIKYSFHYNYAGCPRPSNGSASEIRTCAHVFTAARFRVAAHEIRARKRFQSNIHDTSHDKRNWIAQHDHRSSDSWCTAWSRHEIGMNYEEVIGSGE